MESSIKPVDLEQREEESIAINVLVISKNIAENYGSILFAKDIWNEMFTKALKVRKEKSSLRFNPFLVSWRKSKVKIERIAPMYPMSKDGINYERLIKILSMYRLTLGQARQKSCWKYIF